eukprot:scaffold51_cov401-Prasinococcus_capsulatus_cf.AAC.9
MRSNEYMEVLGKGCRCSGQLASLSTACYTCAPCMSTTKTKLGPPSWPQRNLQTLTSAAARWRTSSCGTTFCGANEGTPGSGPLGWRTELGTVLLCQRYVCIHDPAGYPAGLEMTALNPSANCSARFAVAVA